MSVKPPPAPPALAATLVLLRDGHSSGVEILLIQRHLKSKFAGGDFAFPGGKLTAHDTPHQAAASCAGLDADRAARILALDPGRTALGFWIGAIRETFEEVGILLARGPGGTPPAVAAPRFADYRRACQRDHHAFWTMVAAERLTLATDRLVYFAHWVTPEDQPLRFDTRFFAAPMPVEQEPRGDDREVTAIRWAAPAQALAAYARGEISMRGVTARNLALFEDARSVADALARLATRPVVTGRPRVVVDHEQRRVVIPGDAAG